MKEEFLEKCVIDITKKTVYLYSDDGDKKTVECETIAQFMNVLEVIKDKLDGNNTTIVEYVDIPVYQEGNK